MQPLSPSPKWMHYHFVCHKKKRSQRIWICVYICFPLICMPESTSQHKANFLAIWGMAGGGNEYSLWICFILWGGDTSWACRYHSLSLSLSLSPSHSLSASLRHWEPSLHNLMSLIRLYGGRMDGWMDRWRSLSLSLSLSLCLSPSL